MKEFVLDKGKTMSISNEEKDWFDRESIKSRMIHFYESIGDLLDEYE